MTDQPSAANASSQSGVPNAGEKVCMDCGGDNPVWFAPNYLWNFVIGGPGTRGDPGGFYCPCCFIKRAEQAGVYPTAWTLLPEVLHDRGSLIDRLRQPVRPSYAVTAEYMRELAELHEQAAQAMSASGQGPKGLEAKPASAVAESGAP